MHAGLLQGSALLRTPGLGILVTTHSIPPRQDHHHTRARSSPAPTTASAIRHKHPASLCPTIQPYPHARQIQTPHLISSNPIRRPDIQGTAGQAIHQSSSSRCVVGPDNSAHTRKKLFGIASSRLLHSTIHGSRYRRLVQHLWYLSAGRVCVVWQHSGTHPCEQLHPVRPRVSIGNKQSHSPGLISRE
ncbi:hypothetical protein DFH27DRAFT_246470 [Peziza echinospora]|nr:hypothetical protein DFH27DRAFT_246470 [Peziza echinospora]